MGRHFSKVSWGPRAYWAPQTKKSGAQAPPPPPRFRRLWLRGFPWTFVTAVWLRKLELCPYETVEKVWWYVNSFAHSIGIGRTDRQTDGTGKAVSRSAYMPTRDKNYCNFTQSASRRFIFVPFCVPTSRILFLICKNKPFNVVQSRVRTWTRSTVGGTYSAALDWSNFGLPGATYDSYKYQLGR